jgi:hypothetical protein
MRIRKHGLDTRVAELHHFDAAPVRQDDAAPVRQNDAAPDPTRFPCLI